MSLLDDIAASRGQVGGLCTVRQAMRKHPDIAADLEVALDDDTVPSTAISRALRGRGIAIGDYTVNRHRRRGCQCPR